MNPRANEDLLTLDDPPAGEGWLKNSIWKPAPFVVVTPALYFYSCFTGGKPSDYKNGDS